MYCKILYFSVNFVMARGRECGTGGATGGQVTEAARAAAAQLLLLRHENTR